MNLLKFIGICLEKQKDPYDSGQNSKGAFDVNDDLFQRRGDLFKISVAALWCTILGVAKKNL
ncbi:hypothetical protein HHI36_012631, partial [Cryptolaemus montrouzieri]